MGAPAAPLPTESAPLSLDGDVVGVLVVVGAIALLFVLYLAIDWLKNRREARKLALKRRRAREAWQQELEHLASRSQSPSPTPEDRR